MNYGLPMYMDSLPTVWN